MLDRALLTADVFTTQIFGGNPLAVFPDARGLSDLLMQRIARELNLSETVFVLPALDSQHACRLRIFTPAVELPFAGHPTIGTAVLLAEAGRFGEVGSGIDVVLEEEVGPVPVRLAPAADGLLAATFTVPRRPEAIAHALDQSALAAVLGLPTDALAASVAPGAYSAGVPFTIVPLRDRAALGTIRLNLTAWHEHLADSPAPHLYAVTTDDWTAGRALRARMFAPAMGIPEDPATGAATAALAGFLADHQPLPDGTTSWTVRQGEDMGRPSEIHLSVERSQGQTVAVRIGGTAVQVSRGTFRVPTTQAIELRLV